MRKVLLLGLALLGLAAGIIPSREAWAEGSTVQILARVESQLYGSPQAGGIVDRLARTEKDLFGRELPGNITDRQQALSTFLEQGSEGQPSLLFKLGVGEWAVGQITYPDDSVSDRIGRLERAIEGKEQEEGALAMRLERVLEMLLGEPVAWESVTVPAGTLIRVELAETLSPKTAKAGDAVKLRLNRDLAVENRLVGARGCLVWGTIESVAPPRSFGRPSEVKIRFDHLFPLGPERVAVNIGENAKRAAQADKAVLAATGASFLGVILLGPLGLAGGLFVRGDEKPLPAGTPFYLEIAQDSSTQSYLVPAGLSGLLTPQISSGDLVEPTPVPRPTRPSENNK